MKNLRLFEDFDKKFDYFKTWQNSSTDHKHPEGWDKYVLEPGTPKDIFDIWLKKVKK